MFWSTQAPVEMLLDVIQLILGGVLVLIYRPLLRLVESTRAHAAAANDAVNNRHPDSPKLRDDVTEIRHIIKEIQEDNHRTKQWLIDNCPLAESTCPLMQPSPPPEKET